MVFLPLLFFLSLVRHSVITMTLCNGSGGKFPLASLHGTIERERERSEEQIASTLGCR